MAPRKPIPTPRTNNSHPNALKAIARYLAKNGIKNKPGYYSNSYIEIYDKYNTKHYLDIDQHHIAITTPGTPGPRTWELASPTALSEIIHTLKHKQ